MVDNKNDKLTHKVISKNILEQYLIGNRESYTIWKLLNEQRYDQLCYMLDEGEEYVMVKFNDKRVMLLPSNIVEIIY